MVRPARRGRGSTAVLPSAAAAAFLFALILGGLLQLRYGYVAGTDDHQVLSLQGLQWARSGFLVDDWFVRSSPQPHVLFDVLTWAGARLGHLSAAYLAWWVLGLLVGGVATAVLARAWTPSHPVVASAAVAVLLALGPKVVLGTTTPALPIALPHQLGGFLAYLTSALLLTRRPRAAAVACVLTAVVHVQIGALTAVVCVLAVVLVRLVERRWWWWPVAGAAISGAVVVTVLRLRPVAAEPDDFVQICHEVIPFHCDVPTWSAGQLFSGFCVVAAALLIALPAPGPSRERWPGREPDAPRPAWRRAPLWTAVVLAPALGLTIGVLANRYGVPVLGRFAQSTNIFRLGVLLLPLGAWGLVIGFGGALSRGRRALWLVPAAVAGYGWLEPAGGDTLLPGHLGWVALVVGLGAASALLGLRAGTRAGAVAGVLAAAAVIMLLVAGDRTGRLQARPWRPEFVADPAQRAMGRLIAEDVPPGEVVQVPPSWGLIRLTSGRSLVVDCKAVPYGGAPWRDYRARLDALGGRGACSNGGAPYAALSAESLRTTADRYGARYLVLASYDPRRQALLDAGWQVLSGPHRRSGDIWLLAAPGAVHLVPAAP